MAPCLFLETRIPPERYQQDVEAAPAGSLRTARVALGD
jgi:hypothetical protein